MAGSISEARYYVIKHFFENKGKNSIKEVQAAAPSYLKKTVPQVIYNFAANDLLAVHEDPDNYRAKLYEISKDGRDYYNKVKNYTINPFRGVDQKELKETVSKSPEPLNVSITTESLMNNITEVIHQNAGYRELMLNVVNMVANALDLEVREKGQQNDTLNNQ